MRGMLIKDLRLMKNQGRTLFLMILVVGGVMSGLLDVGPTFIVGYITIIFSLFTVSTVSYDEFDNCYLFLMTLPVTRKKYVNEKYLFALLSTVFAWCAGIVLGLILMIVQSSGGVDAADWFGTCLGYIFTAWIFVSVMLPLRLKFDAEKARYANLIMIAAVAIVAFLISNALEYVPAKIVEPGKEWFFDLGAGGILGLFAGVTALVVIISYLCSRHIMAKKEF